MAAAIADARPPIRHFSGDELRSIDTDVLIERSLGARTVTLGGTGFSHVGDLLVSTSAWSCSARRMSPWTRASPQSRAVSPRAAVAQSSASSASSTKDVKSSMRSSSMANGSAH